jgi:hypothetical protein
MPVIGLVATVLVAAVLVVTTVLVAAGAPNVGRTALCCAGVTLAVVLTVFVVLPAPFHGQPLVLVADAIVLAAGAAATIALPPAVMRSRWAALVVVVALPVYLEGLLVGGTYVPYG